MLLSVSSSDCSFVFAIRAPASVIYTLSLHDALPISFASAVALLAVTTLWNVGLMFQWGSHLIPDRKSTRLNSSHRCISYAVFCLKKKKRRLKLPMRFQRRPHLGTLCHPVARWRSHSA